jgi:hypothetical protein
MVLNDVFIINLALIGDIKSVVSYSLLGYSDVTLAHQKSQDDM